LSSWAGPHSSFESIRVLKLNRKVEYGLIALKYMLGKPRGELTSVREICDLFGTPFDPVAHVLRILNSGQLVESEQGAHGGYRLIADVDTIQFSDFIQLVEGHPLAFADCLREHDCRCTMLNSCNIMGPMAHFHQRIVEFLQSITLADILEERVPPPFVTEGPQENLLA